MDSVSHHTIRTDSVKVYDFEKKKLKALLKAVDRISLTTKDRIYGSNSSFCES